MESEYGSSECATAMKQKLDVFEIPTHMTHTEDGKNILEVRKRGRKIATNVVPKVRKTIKDPIPMDWSDTY